MGSDIDNLPRDVGFGGLVWRVPSRLCSMAENPVVIGSSLLVQLAAQRCRLRFHASDIYSRLHLYRQQLQTKISTVGETVSMATSISPPATAMPDSCYLKYSKRCEAAPRQNRAPRFKMDGSGRVEQYGVQQAPSLVERQRR